MDNDIDEDFAGLDEPIEAAEELEIEDTDEFHGEDLGEITEGELRDDMEDDE